MEQRNARLSGVLRKACGMGALLLLGGAEAFVSRAPLRSSRGMLQHTPDDSPYTPIFPRVKRRQTPRCIVDFRGLKQVALPELAELSYDKLTGKTVTFAASRAAETEVVEGRRTLRDYMALPPSQYSVLDEDAVVRLSEDTFRCQITGVNFFGYKFVPIIYVKVEVDPAACKSYLNVLKIELTGSRIAEIANGTFQVKARNVVSYRPVENRPGQGVLGSTVSVEVEAVVPRANIIPLGVLARGGSLVIQGVLNVMVPQFVKILSKDYQTWAGGDDSRSAVADAKLATEDELTAAV